MVGGVVARYTSVWGLLDSWQSYRDGSGVLLRKLVFKYTME
jgi:hypothetical protein